MPLHASYLDRTFRIGETGAVLRAADDLSGVPDGATALPAGTQVRIDRVARHPADGPLTRIFAHASPVAAAGPAGWISTGDLDGQFRNVTLRRIEPGPADDRFGPCAAWHAGAYLGQVPLIEIVNARQKPRRIGLGIAPAYAAMLSAAQADGVEFCLSSGFRSYPEQAFYHAQYVDGVPGFFKADRPGFSAHQSGVAIDIPVGGGETGPVYGWLAGNAPRFGFLRTEPTEPWHWEYRPERARDALARGAHCDWS